MELKIDERVRRCGRRSLGATLAVSTLALMSMSWTAAYAGAIGARAAGQERDMGSIEPGKLANMFVLQKDPLSTIDDLKTLVMTIKRGRVFARGDFAPLQDDDVVDLD